MVRYGSARNVDPEPLAAAALATFVADDSANPASLHLRRDDGPRHLGRGGGLRRRDRRGADDETVFRARDEYGVCRAIALLHDMAGLFPEFVDNWLIVWNAELDAVAFG